MLLKQKSPSLPKNLAHGTFDELLIVFSAKVNHLNPLFIGTEVLSSASYKTKFFAKDFSNNSNLDGSGISVPAFPSRTNLKLHNISVTPKMAKSS